MKDLSTLKTGDRVWWDHLALMNQTLLSFNERQALDARQNDWLACGTVLEVTKSTHRLTIIADDKAIDVKLFYFKEWLTAKLQYIGVISYEEALTHYHPEIREWAKSQERSHVLRR